MAVRGKNRMSHLPELNKNYKIDRLLDGTIKQTHLPRELDEEEEEGSEDESSEEESGTAESSSDHGYINNNILARENNVD